MAKSFQEVQDSLQKEEIQTNYDALPEERGEFRVLPQPGSFRFITPDNIDACFDVMEVDVKGPDGKATGAKKKRLKIEFRKDKALVIAQSKGAEHDGEDFEYTITDLERPRGKEKVQVSDLTYLLRALAPDVRPKDKTELPKICASVIPGKTFGADLEYSGFCNPTKDAYFAVSASDAPDAPVTYETYKAEGSTENVKGCGRRLYHSQWTKVNGVFAERMSCPGIEGGAGCGASIRPFASLVRFKA